jgi:integrase/recombinase XerD
MSNKSVTALPAAVEAVVEDYRKWLVNERSLAPTTISYCVPEARSFLAERDGLDLQSLTLGDVTSFVVRECRRRTVASAQHMVVGLRLLLRYLYVEGLTDRPLAPAVPAPSSWHGSNLPRWLSNDELAALLVEVNDGSALGRRNHAIVVLLVRLGLRAGEVAALTLDDIDWRVGEIVVRGKRNRTEALPLPVDVGEALVAYLRDGRPPTTCRALFLRTTHAPLAGLSAAGVGGVVRRAGHRAGLSAVGAHRLRHAAATAMLRSGASLEDVGQVLRHRSGQITAIYAKVDFVALRPLALSWPGDAA